ncbi:MAG TPA: hypothetical protein VJ937_05885 [Salinivirga sp.]|uniref:hypothetical protein n=1 Tax=Salinivirga sp. TaxID=1970192 RepID=UPI002B469653|nr:hypothetical protein [Salinivirga sp.]HKK58986.1 hypothetical protein [Salinivirga sp.]
MAKKILLFAAFFLFITLFANAQYHERDWKWQPYASLTKGGKVFIVLYYGTLIEGYNGKVRWKIVNRAAQPLFGVDLGAQTYVLKNGEEVQRDERDFKARRINPGENAMTLPVVIEQQAFSGVKRVKVSTPEIILDFGKDRIYEWGKLGKIELAVQ